VYDLGIAKWMSYMPQVFAYERECGLTAFDEKKPSTAPRPKKSTNTYAGKRIHSTIKTAAIGNYLIADALLDSRHISIRCGLISEAKEFLATEHSLGNC